MTSFAQHVGDYLQRPFQRSSGLQMLLARLGMARAKMAGRHHPSRSLDQALEDLDLPARQRARIDLAPDGRSSGRAGVGVLDDRGDRVWQAPAAREDAADHRVPQL